MLRQAGVYPIKIYSDQRPAEFSEANKLTPEQEKRWGPVLADPSRWPTPNLGRAPAVPKAARSARAKRR